MTFGDPLRPADTTASTSWIHDACKGDPWTVGALVPNHYESLLRVYPPAPCDGWWSAYRELFKAVAEVGERHTSCPDRAWFAVWEGHGFGSGSRRIAWSDAISDDAERQARDIEQRRALDEAKQRNTDIVAELARIPRFSLPERTYFLLTGPVAAVTEMSYPDSDDWRNPDLFWPDDRRWFVATDVDFWSLYIGGTRRFTSEIAVSLPTPSAPVELELLLATED